MKKTRILSVLLAVIMAFSCLSVTAVSAEETSTLEITNVPEDIFYADFENMLYGITVQLPDGSTVVTNEDNFTYEGCNDLSTAIGRATTFGNLESDDFTIDLYADVYVSDKIELCATYFDLETGDIYDSTEIVEYPSDFETPDVFYRDDIVYRKNTDDTLTIISYLGHEGIDDDFNIIYPVVDIPESVDGMTVTDIADNAFLSSDHPVEVTIPQSVTSIGRYAFGYCFDSSAYGKIHEFPDNIITNLLAYQLRDANDNEKFLIDISLNSDDCDTYAEYIKTTYLANCEDFEYIADNGQIYATATKAEILSMADETELSITLIYEKDNYTISDPLYYVMNTVSDDELIPIIITTMAYDESDGEKIKNNIISNYFDKYTPYGYEEFDTIYIDATKSQIESMKNDIDISYIRLGDSYSLDENLNLAIYFAEDSDAFNIYIPANYIDNPEDLLPEIHETYFDNCESQLFYSNSEPIFIIYGASKTQILNAANDNCPQMFLFGEPSINKYYNITIYGATGSVAEVYADLNYIDFVPTSNDDVLMGDVDEDGIVNISDATLIQKYCVERVTLSANQLIAADVNGDGIVNVSDATAIQKLLVA